MTRALRWLTALALCCSTASASAQNVETVTVSANSLAGTWEILGPLPQRANDSRFKLHCRIEHALSAPAVYCFERKAGRLTVSQGTLRIVWAPTLIDSNVLEGKLISIDSFTANERARKMGIILLKRDGLIGTRLTFDPQAADNTDNAPALAKTLKEQANGAMSEPHDGALVELPDTASLRALGAVTTITFIDHAQVVINDRIVPDFFDLYAVDFQNGHRLCGLHQREDGVIDGFRCV